MTTDLEVYWYDECGNFTIYKVYCIDSTMDRFLIANASGRFKWVKTDECKIVEEDDD